MKMCSFPGCQRLDGHSPNTPHAMWDERAAAWVPLAEQRTRAVILAESRERMRREKAERIARDIYAQGRSQRVESAENEVLAMLEAAALQALTESENAR